MKPSLIALAAAAALPAAMAQETGLVADGIPPIPEAVRAAAAPYMEFRTASFLGWHPQRKEMLVATRFADTPQLHEVKFPGAARRQLTFLPEPIRGAGWQPKSGKSIVFVQDAGGGENYQFFRFDPSNGRTDRLTDGTSRNTSLRWSHDGSQFACASTRRTRRRPITRETCTTRPMATSAISTRSVGRSNQRGVTAMRRRRGAISRPLGRSPSTSSR